MVKSCKVTLESYDIVRIEQCKKIKNKTGKKVTNELCHRAFAIICKNFIKKNILICHNVTKLGGRTQQYAKGLVSRNRLNRIQVIKFVTRFVMYIIHNSIQQLIFVYFCKVFHIFHVTKGLW